EHSTDAVAGVSSDRYTLVDAGHFARDNRVVEAKPDGAGPIEEATGGNAGFDEVEIAEVSVFEWGARGRRVIGRARRLRQWMAGQACRHRLVTPALRQSSEPCNLLTLPIEARRDMRRVATGVVDADFDAELRDRDRPKQVGRQPSDMRHLPLRSDTLDRA